MEVVNGDAFVLFFFFFLSKTFTFFVWVDLFFVQFSAKSHRLEGVSSNPPCVSVSRPHCSFMGMVISHDMLLGRWRLSLELFGRVFMEDVGAEPGSVC